MDKRKVRSSLPPQQQPYESQKSAATSVESGTQPARDELRESSLHVVEILSPGFEDSAQARAGRRWAYACIHRFSAPSGEYDVWFLEDVTRVSAVFTHGFEGLGIFQRSNRQNRRRKGIDVEYNPRYFDESMSEDEGTWTSVISSIVPGLSHVLPGKRRRSKTEPAPVRRRETQQSSSSANGASSPVIIFSSNSHRSQGTFEGARDFILNAAEDRIVSLASIFGLGTIPTWIFARIRQALAAPPAMMRGIKSASAEDLTSLDESATQSTVALQLNAFGRIHQAYPISSFLGMSTEILMNRFIMRFVYEDDIPQLCRGMSQAIREGKSVFYVRWDWRSKQEEQDGDEETENEEVDTTGPTLEDTPVDSKEQLLSVATSSATVNPDEQEEKEILPKDTPQPPPLMDAPPPRFYSGRRQSACEASAQPLNDHSPLHIETDISKLQSAATSQLSATNIVRRIVWVQITAIIVEPTQSSNASFNSSPLPPEPLAILALVSPLPDTENNLPGPNWISDSTLGPVPNDHHRGPILHPPKRALMRVSKSSPALPIHHFDSYHDNFGPNIPPPPYSQEVPHGSLIAWPYSLSSFVYSIRQRVAAISNRLSNPLGSNVLTQRSSPSNGSLTPRIEFPVKTELADAGHVRQVFPGGGMGAGY
ncbi:hypothetical protein HDU97_000109 [Phlyctochytrium planicorne]|nr:hypothetical protein HDU97_000109 [Phlyctochytrium planicorne]